MSEPSLATKFKSLGGPIDIVKAGIKAVPAVKWALGVAGIAAALAIIVSFFSDITTAFVGIGVMILFMTLLVIFAAAASLKGSEFRVPALVLTWATLVLFVGSATLFASSVFFDWPKSVRDLISGEGPSHKPNATAGKSSSARETPSSNNETHDPHQTAVPTAQARIDRASPPDILAPEPAPKRASELPQAPVIQSPLKKPEAAETFRLCEDEARLLLDGKVAVELSFHIFDRDKVGTVSFEVPDHAMGKLDLSGSGPRTFDFDYNGRHNRVAVIAVDSAEFCATFQLISQPQTKSDEPRKVSP